MIGFSFASRFTGAHCIRCYCLHEPGKQIPAAVGVGFSADTFGVIMEYSGYCSKEEAEAKIVQMLEEAFASRGMELVKTEIRSVEHTVKSIGCALAAVNLWY